MSQSGVSLIFEVMFKTNDSGIIQWLSKWNTLTLWHQYGSVYVARLAVWFGNKADRALWRMGLLGKRFASSAWSMWPGGTSIEVQYLYQCMSILLAW